MGDVLTIWCFLPNEGGPFPVEISGQEVIDGLKDVIYNECANSFKGIDAKDLCLYKPKGVIALEPTLSFTERMPQDDQSFDRLSPSRRVSDYYPTLDPDALHVLIRYPNRNEVHNHTRGPGYVLFSQNQLTEHHQSVSFKITVTGDKPDWSSVEARNGYIVSNSGVLPGFIEEIVHRRRAPHEDDRGVVELMRFLRNRANTEGREEFHGPNAFSSVLPDFLSSEDTAKPYTKGFPEVWHYLFAMQYMFPSYRRAFYHAEEEAKISDWNESILRRFGFYWGNRAENTVCRYGEDTSISLVAVESTKGSMRVTRVAKYAPRPDAMFTWDGFPYFLCEIDSHVNRKDKYQLYVQMACALRLGLEIFDVQAPYHFFIMGVLFTSRWEIHRLFAYPKDGRVKFASRTYDMKDDAGRTTFLAEFYNYAMHVTKDLDAHKNMKVAIENLTSSIKDEYIWTLHTGQFSSGKHGGDEDMSKHRKGTDIQDVIALALDGLGFKMKDTNDRDYYGPFTELPENVVEASTRSGKAIIAKLPRKGSNEFSLLQKLSCGRSQYNHVIRLLAIVKTRLGPLVILDRATPFSDYLRFWQSRLRDSFREVCHQLIEGVAFLHGHMIAHLDIKPSNVVINLKTERIFVIDFDLARECNDINEMVKISSGTRGYAAPEIILDEDKPSKRISPIRADLWSCGIVLKEILDRAGHRDRDILLLIKLLTVTDASQRPLLHRLIDEKVDFWASGRFAQALHSHELIVKTDVE